MKNQEPEQDQEQQPELGQQPDQAPVPKRGRPVEREWPEPIPDTPENIARRHGRPAHRAKTGGSTSRTTGTGTGSTRNPDRKEGANRYGVSLFCAAKRGSQDE